MTKKPTAKLYATNTKSVWHFCLCLGPFSTRSIERDCHRWFLFTHLAESVNENEIEEGKKNLVQTHDHLQNKLYFYHVSVCCVRIDKHEI